MGVQNVYHSLGYQPVAFTLRILQIAFLHVAVLVGIYLGQFVRKAGHRVLVSDFQHRVALITALGGYQDDAVCGTGAINGGGRGILEHLDGLDVVRVQLVDIRGRDAVNHPQGAYAGIVHGGSTTDDDGGAFTRLSGTGSNLDTGGRALQGIEHIGGHLVLNVFLGHRDDGTGNVPFLGGTVTNHHGLIQYIGSIFHFYVQAIGNTSNAVHVFIAQEAELNDVVGTGDTDGIMTFFIGDDTLFGLGIQYRSTG